MESQQIVSFGWEDFPLIESVPYVCERRPDDKDKGQSHSAQNKRKYLPVVQSNCNSIVIEPSAKLLAFGWEDFPCVDYSNDFFLTIPPSVLSDSLHLFETPDLAELSNSSDESSSSDEDEKRSQMNIAKKKVQPDSLSAKVVFRKTMEVREYARTEGDHPFTPRFCLTLDWEYYPTVKMTLPDDTVRNNRRPKRLSVRERRDRLDFATEMVDTFHML